MLLMKECLHCFQPKYAEGTGQALTAPILQSHPFIVVDGDNDGDDGGDNEERNYVQN